MKPVTEWAGMTDWVVAVRERNPRESIEVNRWEVVKNRVGRNDRLGSGNGGKGSKAEERKREEVAKDRVGRNDRLSQGKGGEAEEREVKTCAEAARD